MPAAPSSLPFLHALRAAPSFAPVRWVLTTMAMAAGLSMMFGVRPTEAFPTAPSDTASSAVASARPSAGTAAAESLPLRAADTDDRHAARDDRTRPAR